MLANAVTAEKNPKSFLPVDTLLVDAGEDFFIAGQRSASASARGRSLLLQEVIKAVVRMTMSPSAAAESQELSVFGTRSTTHTSTTSSNEKCFRNKSNA